MEFPRRPVRCLHKRDHSLLVPELKKYSWFWANTRLRPKALSNGLRKTQSDRPEECNQRRAHAKHDERKRQPQPPVIAEVIAARTHHQRVALVADRRKEIAGRA